MNWREKWRVWWWNNFTYKWTYVYTEKNPMALVVVGLVIYCTTIGLLYESYSPKENKKSQPNACRKFVTEDGSCANCHSLSKC